MPAIDIDLSFEPSTAPRIKLLHVGDESNPVLVIDDFFTNPEKLVKLAALAAPFDAVSTDLYPGARHNLDTHSMGPCTASIESLARDTFGFAVQRNAVPTFAAFSVVSRAPELSLPIQRIPHFDTSNSDQLAMVVYLFKRDFGGTSFYRHRATKFESISPSRAQSYTRTLEREARTLGVPGHQYIDGNTELFERTATIDAKFNRCVIYKSNLLHAGNIAHCLDPSPKTGRLTTNAFISFAKT